MAGVFVILALAGFICCLFAAGGVDVERTRARSEADAMLTRAQRQHIAALEGRRGRVEQAFARVKHERPEMVGDAVGGYVPAPLRPWTDAEREAFGVNATEEWIKQTDRILRQAEWDAIPTKGRS